MTRVLRGLVILMLITVGVWLAGSVFLGPDAARAMGMRVSSDLRNEKISYKVREHSVQKVPYIIAVGGREEEAGTVALRRLGSNEQEVIDMEEALRRLHGECLPPDLARLAAE